MPPKTTQIYSCSNCDAQFAKWQGRCLECGAWGSVSEQAQLTSKSKPVAQTPPAKTLALDDISLAQHPRISTNIPEIDRVLGGGIVPGSLILLGGDPGVGKSTLALQVAHQIKNTLYISGEESAQQIKMRAQRLGLKNEGLRLLPQTTVETIVSTVNELKPGLAVIDSIQTINTSGIANAPGSVSQITACTSLLLEAAKSLNVPIIIIGHVTKDGFIAGPKTLEHLVDTVLYLEHDNRNHYKILRGVKNRFGSIGEIGIFEMTASGFIPIADPSQLFVEQDQNKQLLGTALSLIIEGSRPFLVEIQALTSRTSFGYPQRKATGIDINRLQLLLAVLGKVGNLDLSSQDTYLNVAGGLKTKDPATDLAICAALISAYSNRPLPKQTLWLGEVGLTGELRSVSQLDRRIEEAKRLGFTNIVTPPTKIKTTGVSIVAFSSIAEVLHWFIKQSEATKK